ncbi:MAG: alkaline phosphatase family protein [Defluviitaleaceae bacterium]|nr:alkaline phosphatase family protein [Defluviitaleaceae bacterium]
MLKPNYDNSIMSITNSLLKYYGKVPHHATLPIVDDLLKLNYKNIVLLVMDGMGINVLEKHLPENAFLRKNVKAKISSVFPPTTTAATTSILTGKTPLEHGWIGWSCYFKEVDKCVDLYSNNESGTLVQASEKHQSHTHLAYESIFDKIGDKVRTCYVSAFSNQYIVNTMEDICATIKNLCDEDGEKFIYAYHSQPDHAMHDFGVLANCVNEMMIDYNNQLEMLMNELSDTLFLITADHGMTDITMKCVEDYPQINEMLIRHICVEPRCCSFYVKDGHIEEFPKVFNEAFPDKFWLLTHDEFLQSELLGIGEKHSKIKDFVGDYMAIAVADIALWYKDINGEYNDFKGAHAGWTKEELIVPLIAIEV